MNDVDLDFIDDPYRPCEVCDIVYHEEFGRMCDEIEDCRFSVAMLHLETIAMLGNTLEEAHARTIATLEAEKEQLTAVCHESNAVCACGCPAEAHTPYDDDGEACERMDHECVRTSEAVLSMLRASWAEVTALRAQLATVHQTIKTYEEFMRPCDLDAARRATEGSQ